MVAERLSGWSDQQLEDDLAAYDDVDPDAASATRDRLLGWLKANGGAKR